MTGSAGGDRRPLPELLPELTTASSTLVRQELHQAKADLRGEAVTAAKGSAVLVVAAVGGLLTLAFARPPRRGVRRR